MHVTLRTLNTCDSDKVAETLINWIKDVDQYLTQLVYMSITSQERLQAYVLKMCKG
jgi:predicted HAD superfamily phosphohydrolase YqeG